MKILLTGACGFVGNVLAAALPEYREGLEIIGVDNLIRSGSERNRAALQKRGQQFVHCDIRSTSDVEALPPTDFIIDAAANPSVLAGLGENTSSRQLMEHNLAGTINLLEYCKEHRAGLILLSTSRVYSIKELSRLTMEVVDNAFRPAGKQSGIAVSNRGVRENFSTEPPRSLYGAAKLASENLALEYGGAFDFPVWINRCGVLAGAGQFGKMDQGIFSFWIHSYRARRPLRFLGFGGHGYQVRDCLHPRDLASAILRQIETTGERKRVSNFSGGVENGVSLRQLNDWCIERFGRRTILRAKENRPFDVPWLVLDSSQAGKEWNWRPQTPLQDILEEIAVDAEANPNWLDSVG